MKAAIAFVFALAVVAGATLWYRASDGEAQLRERVAAEHAKMSSGSALAPEAVLAIRPGAPRAPAASTPEAVVSPLTRDIIQQRPLKPVYDRLVNKADRTGEEDWALAVALRCARTTEQRKRFPSAANAQKAPAPPTLAQRREKFAAALSPKAANRDRRLAAFDDASANPCEGFKDIEVSEKDITALLEQGSAKGDLKARVNLLDQRWMQAMMSGNEQGRRGVPSMSDADLETLKDIGGGPDPVAARAAFQGMMRSYDNFSLRVADTEEPVERSALYYALQLMGCDDGVDCGPGNRTLRSACAMQGQCDITNLRDYIFFYSSTPASSQLVEQYSSALQRARRGDWSYFTFFPGPTPSDASWR